MNRKVHAILMSVPKPSANSKPVPCADKALGEFRQMLEKRFPGPELTIDLILQPSATRTRVIAAFERAIAELSDDALFIVLFIGHGIESDGDLHAYQAWKLEKSESCGNKPAEFSDEDLAGYLTTLSAQTNNVEVVIISASCYGAGIATDGPFALPTISPIRGLLHDALIGTLHAIYKHPLVERYRALKLRALAAGWSPAALLDAAKPSTRSKLNKLVCISAAAWWDEVALPQVTKLIDKTVAVANCNGTYGALADVFDENAVSGAMFEVLARPNDRMCHKLLAPAVVL
jgi:hypothetical protein